MERIAASRRPTGRRFERARVALHGIGFTLLVGLASLAGGQDATIDWWSVDAGGEIRSSGGDWELSGTLGQWDSTEGHLLIGGAWQVTGGFWAAEAPASDALFIDGFEN